MIFLFSNKKNDISIIHHCQLKNKSININVIKLPNVKIITKLKLPTILVFGNLDLVEVLTLNYQQIKLTVFTNYRQFWSGSVITN